MMGCPRGERENQSIRAVRIVCIIGEKEEERNTPFREATRQSRHRLQAAKKAGGSGRGVERWVSHLEGVAALNGEGLILAGIEKDSADIVVAKMFPPVQSESSNGRIRIQYSPSHPCPAFHPPYSQDTHCAAFRLLESQVSKRASGNDQNSLWELHSHTRCSVPRRSARKTH